MTTQISPTLYDRGIAIERPQYVYNLNLNLPKVEIDNLVGLLEMNIRLVDNIIELKGEVEKESGLFGRGNCQELRPLSFTNYCAYKMMMMVVW